MKERTFFISHEEQQLGPFTQEQILEKVQSGDLSPVDYVFDESCQDWVVLMKHALFADSIKDKVPKGSKDNVVPLSSGSPSHGDKNARSIEGKSMSNQPISSASISNESVQDHLVTEWYVLKGENKFGPFAFTDVVKMLQQKVVFEFDFAWHPKMTSWKRIAEIESFNYENIKNLKKTLMPEIEELFFRRRHRRTGFNGTILVHDNKSVWKGQGVEISAGGAGIIMENAMVVPGQTLYLHFKPCDGVPPFNAVCEVVSKQYVDGIKEKTSPIKYGVKFTSISTSTQNALSDYTKKSIAA